MEEQRVEEGAVAEVATDRGEESPLDISLDEVEPAETPASEEPALLVEIDDEEESAPPPGDDRLVITGDDLLDMPDEPAQAAYPGMARGDAKADMQYPGMSGVEYPGMSGAPYPAGAKSSPVTQLLGAVLWQLALAGAAGGFLAWLINEPFMDGRENATILFSMGLFGGVIGGSIGACLGAVEGIAGRVYEKAVTGGLLGLAIGFGGGFLGGIVGQIVYSMLDGGREIGIFEQMVARTVGWAAVGACVGLGQGVAIRSSRKLLNGLLGGVIGGAIGGFLFDIIGSLFSTGIASRAIAITVLGGCAGAAIGMVEELAKQAWLRVTQGPLAGKEFILYHPATTLGSSPKCEITIPKDPRILPQHAVIHNTGYGYTMENFDEREPAYVNGRPAQRTTLRDGDQLQLGQTVMLYAERAARQEKMSPYSG